MVDIFDSREYVGKCTFCPLGDASARGVVKVTRMEKVSRDEGSLGEEFIVTRNERVTRYQCGLGDIGKDCIIPILYKKSTLKSVGIVDIPIG